MYYDYISNISGVLYVAGTVYPSRGPEFFPGVLVVSLLLTCIVMCVIFCLFVCLRSVSCVSDVSSIYELSILDCPFGL